jgi:hypothetical protein
MMQTLTAWGLGLALLGAAPAAAQPRAAFQAELASAAVRTLADWVAASGDNQGLPFVVVDKVAAKVFVFRPDATLRGAAPVLLGLARGDVSTPGVGDLPLARIKPGERTTPAGRFVADRGKNLGDHDILWIDYKNAISLHPVVTTNPKEHRLRRLATQDPADNRISYGCINVPAAFYKAVVAPAFTGTSGIVYILPEVRPIGSVFPGLAAVATR